MMHESWLTQWPFCVHSTSPMIQAPSSTIFTEYKGLRQVLFNQFRRPLLEWEVGQFGYKNEKFFQLGLSNNRIICGPTTERMVCFTCCGGNCPYSIVCVQRPISYGDIRTHSLPAAKLLICFMIYRNMAISTYVIPTSGQVI
jgi:hypothetical protein